MKRFFPLAAGFCLLVSAGFAEDVWAGKSSASFEQANAKYQAGDFKAAAEAYEKMIQSGDASAAVHYNLGNAYFRLGKRGKALVSCQRALRLLPRDKDIQWNIRVLTSAFTDKLETSDENLVIFWIRRAADFFTMDELALMLSAGFAVFLVTVLVSVFLPGLRLLPQFFQLFLVPVVAAAAILLAFKWQDTREPRLVILDKEVTARYGPSERETKAFRVHEGAEARLLDESKEWVYVSIDSGNSGWIPKKSCEVI